jgi:hypothetical protein
MVMHCGELAERAPENRYEIIEKNHHFKPEPFLPHPARPVSELCLRLKYHQDFTKT